MEESEPIAPVFVDDNNAPELFCTFVAAVSPAGPGILRMTFVSERVSPRGNNVPNSHVVNLRMVMSTPGVQNMVEFLQGYLANQQAAIQRPPDNMLN